MTDRELLELAAKAAGLEADFTGEEVLVSSLFRGHLKNWDIWNPLKDDGDALRLAVKLALFEDFDFHLVLAQAQSEADPFAATRRSIVRAAASLAK